MKKIGPINQTPEGRFVNSFSERLFAVLQASETRRIGPSNEKGKTNSDFFPVGAQWRS
jgi:hypothetical protein